MANHGKAPFKCQNAELQHAMNFAVEHGLWSQNDREDYNKKRLAETVIPKFDTVEPVLKDITGLPNHHHLGIVQDGFGFSGAGFAFHAAPHLDGETNLRTMGVGSSRFASTHSQKN